MVFYGGMVAVELKQNASPFTAADSASHDVLVESLEALVPGIPVVSEESPDATEAAVAAADPFWLVDPLDGTKEFLKGTHEFTVNVALVQAGKPVLGVVHAPALALTYLGIRGSNAWRRVNGGAWVPIQCRRADLKALSVVASRDHVGPGVFAMLERMPTAKLQSMGSSLKFCLVAEGKADIYFRDVPTMEWDTAAAQCVVEAAGGMVCELSGVPLRYGKPELRNGSIMTVGDPDFLWQAYVTA